jgi:Post-segregation antitoxin CcdA
MSSNLGRKVPVELVLNEQLVREAQEILGDVSASVEESLRCNVERETLRRAPDFQERLDATIELVTNFYEQHGVWGEEFSTL